MPTKRIVESWLRSITPFTWSPAELSERLVQLGIEVESFEDHRARLAGFVVGMILSRDPHPNADRLSVCTVTTGEGPITVVCGAPNVAEGQKIAFAPVGTHIPTADFTIERRKIRGVESVGMICSESELGIGESHDGIMVLPADAPVGASLADLLGDVIYDYDITANRGDCLSHLGIAREVAAVTGEEIFLPPIELQESQTATDSVVSIETEEPELCHRYVARVVRGVKNGPSPAWLQDRLRKLGLRPRNIVVDVTSYVLFECGHPLHAFDLDLVRDATVIVKKGKEGETFVTLDGKSHALPKDALMICDAERPIAIAGVMGGENSEISDGTTNVLIESAWFDPTSVRRTARRLGLSTDASFRFERGGDIEITTYAADRAAQMIQELAGGEVLAGRLDIYPTPRPEIVVELRFRRCAELLGYDISPDRQIELLERLGFEVDREDEERAMVAVPSWRNDVAIEEDLIEEIARLNGYDQIPVESRATVTFDLSTNRLQRLIGESRSFMVANGFDEIVGHHLTDPETAAAYGRPVELANALGRDFSALRTSMLPTLARTIGANRRRGVEDLRLFEVGVAFRRSESGKGVIPGIVEMHELSIALAGAAEPRSWDLADRASDLYDLRGIVDRWLSTIGVREHRYEAVSEDAWGFGSPALRLFAGDDEVGRLGPLDGDLLRRHDLEEWAQPVVAAIDLGRLEPHAFHVGHYVQPSKYPVVRRDLSILVDAGIPAAAIDETIRRSAGELLLDLDLFDLYQGKGVAEGERSMSYALRFVSHERTLEVESIDTLVGSVVRALESEHGAKLRGGG